MSDSASSNSSNHRVVLRKRRAALFEKLLCDAEEALTKKNWNQALHSAARAGLLDPSDVRVNTILEETQRTMRADPSAVTWPKPGQSVDSNGTSIGPASWSTAAPFVGSPQRTTSTVSVCVSIGVHVVIATATIIALIRVVQPIDMTNVMGLALPGELPGSALAAAAADAASQEPEVSEEPVEETDLQQLVPLVAATTPLSELRINRMTIQRPVSAAFRGARTSGGSGVPGGSPGGQSRGGGSGGLPSPEAERDRAPQLLRAVPPVYPQAAFDQGFEGIVAIELQVVVSSEGEVERATILQGVPLLNQAAQDAVMQWRYSPGYRNGFRVPAIIRVSITFDFR